jgi:hypothetical protein
MGEGRRTLTTKRRRVNENRRTEREKERYNYDAVGLPNGLTYVVVQFITDSYDDPNHPARPPVVLMNLARLEKHKEVYICNAMRRGSFLSKLWTIFSSHSQELSGLVGQNSFRVSLLMNVFPTLRRWNKVVCMVPAVS